jgi:hypothetical protein
MAATMRCAFVALVSRQGLESLLPESAAACRWSLDVACSRLKATCLWAVLERRAAAEVLELLTDGDAVAALSVLSLAAESIGPLTCPDNCPATRH